MNNKEILEYSKQLIDSKKEIESAEVTEPDLDEQVKTKFKEDSVNRARFIDSTLLIGAASKEFRNVFGVDAPHYEISDKCYLAVDRNGNGRYYDYIKDNGEPQFQENKNILVNDPMNDDVSTSFFMDCWEMMNASRFDSGMLTKNFLGDDDNLTFVEKQKFFIDSKRSSESSPAHNPICPPGYNKWAGNIIYDKICKCFDLDELNLYRLLAADRIQTIPSVYSFNANGDDKFECNIDENGVITKNIFRYKYMRNGSEYDDPIIKASNDGTPLPAGCTAEDIKPIKWYNCLVPVRTTSLGDGTYHHELILRNTPFEKCDLALVEFELTEVSPTSKIRTFLKALGKESQIGPQPFNSGYAILARNPNQAMPNPRERGIGLFSIQYSVNIIYKENDTLNRGDSYQYEKDKKFLFWKVGTKTVTEKRNYTVTFYPINDKPQISILFWNRSPIANKATSNIAKFIWNMENESIQYYDWMEQRKLKNVIPDYENSREKMIALRDAAKVCQTTPSRANWNAMIAALKNRVKYDIGTNDDSVLNMNVSTRKVSTASIISSTSYISSWESNWVPRWPKWLRRLLKGWSTPMYSTYYKIRVSNQTLNSSFRYWRPESSITYRATYNGPKSGDMTKSRGSMMTVNTFLTYYLNETQKQALRAGGYLDDNYFIGIPLTSRTLYEFVIENSYSNSPTYNNIARATVLNKYLKDNETFYYDAFIAASDRINKRTGTLRRTHSLLESANINAQMIEQKKRNMAHLFQYMNAYEITSGFGSNIATIKLAAWEPYTSAYANLGRMSTVYLLGDNTELDKNNENFVKNYGKATITEIVDMVSDATYTYSLTTDLTIDKKKKYYVFSESSGQYIEATEDYLIDDNLSNLYERSMFPSTGPIFKVTLSSEIPSSLNNRNPRLVKVY